MRIPEIDNIAVQQRSGIPEIVERARSEAFDVFSKGFEMIGQEMVRSQQQKAAADLANKLNDVEQEIEANPSVNTEYVRKKLGSLDGLPPEIRAQVTKQGLDLQTGEMVEMDRDDVPMFAVAGAIYDSEARKAVSEASSKITLGGWAKDFETQAQEHVAQRKSKMAMQQIKASVAHLQVEDTKTAIDFARAGDFVRARDVVTKSKAMDAEYKDKMGEQIDKMEQVRPVYEALQRDDYGSMMVLLGKLNDPKEFTKLDPDERAAFSERLKSEVAQFQKQIETQQDKVFKQAAQDGWNVILAKVRAGATPSYKDIPLPGQIYADDQKAMIEYIDNKRKGTEPTTDLVLYDYLTNMARTNPEKFAEIPLTRMINKLSPTDFKHFVDLQSKPPGVQGFDDFINTDEAIEAKLPKQFSRSKIKDDDGKLAQVGQIKQIVQHELAALGHRPTLQERDDIIDRVIKDNIETVPHWYGDDVKVSTMGVPPKYVVALRQVAAQLGAGLTPAALKATYTDFSTYEEGLATAWRANGKSKGKRLSPAESLAIYGYMKKYLKDIDAELARVGRGNLTGKMLDDARAALAVDSYLSSPTR